MPSEPNWPVHGTEPAAIVRLLQAVEEITGVPAELINEVNIERQPGWGATGWDVVPRVMPVRVTYSGS